MSLDGGKSFANVGGGTHGDHHDVWIDPTDTQHVITGDDGGLWQSYDGGNKWWKQNNLPVSQFYHVSHRRGRSVPRLRRPAGQQLVGRRQRVSRRHHERALGEHVRRRRLLDVRGPGRSGLHLRRSAGRQRSAASIGRRTSRARSSRCRTTTKSCAATGTRRSRCRRTKGHDLHRRAVPVPLARPRPELGSHLARPHDERPEKQKQEESGGVTVDNSAAETHTTIYSISESPKQAGLIWVGTDDGNVQVTRDGGKSWTTT